jgi:hypothetical protein
MKIVARLLDRLIPTPIPAHISSAQPVADVLRAEATPSRE